MSSNDHKHETAVQAQAVPANAKKSAYPEPFASQVGGRVKRKLGDHFGLVNFGVNLTTLAPGAISALLHRHKVQDEFVYILAGHPTLITDGGEQALAPGMCVGFPAQGVAHQIVNRSTEPATFLEVGDRLPGDEGNYPNDDLQAKQDAAGQWYFVHKDGSAYD